MGAEEGEEEEVEKKVERGKRVTGTRREMTLVGRRLGMRDDKLELCTG